MFTERFSASHSLEARSYLQNKQIIFSPKWQNRTSLSLYLWSNPLWRCSLNLQWIWWGTWANKPNIWAYGAHKNSGRGSWVPQLWDEKENLLEFSNASWKPLLHTKSLAGLHYTQGTFITITFLSFNHAKVKTNTEKGMITKLKKILSLSFSLSNLF